MSGQDVFFSGVASPRGAARNGKRNLEVRRAFLTPFRVQQEDWMKLCREMAQQVQTAIFAGLQSKAQTEHERAEETQRIIIALAPKIGTLMGDAYEMGVKDFIGRGAQPLRIDYGKKPEEA